MATEQEILDRNVEEHRLSERIIELENLLQQTDKLRKLNFLAVSVSLLLMLIVLTLFIIGLIGFFRQYPKRELMQNIFRQSRKVMYSGFSKESGRSMDSRTLGIVQRELHSTIKERLPQLRQELRRSARSLKNYMNTQLKAEFRTQLYKRLMLESKGYLSAGNISADKYLMAQLSVMNSELASKITEDVFAQLNAARKSGDFFRQEMHILQQSQEYRHLTMLPRSMVEDRFIESLLECGICKINENKGMEPAVPGGLYE